MSNQQVAKHEGAAVSAPGQWGAREAAILRSSVAPDLNEEEFAVFGQVCARTGLDPFLKQIYAIKRGGKTTYQIGIDGQRLIAQRAGRVAGTTAPEWCGSDGEWKEIWLDDEPPAAARYGVYVAGSTAPFWGIATYREYAQFYKGQPQGLWGTMPATMLIKCAESQALRKACPGELAGLYTHEEMSQAGGPEVDSDGVIQEPKAKAPSPGYGVNNITAQGIRDHIKAEMGANSLELSHFAAACGIPAEKDAMAILKACVEYVKNEGPEVAGENVLVNHAVGMKSAASDDEAIDGEWADAPEEPELPFE